MLLLRRLTDWKISYPDDGPLHNKKYFEHEYLSREESMKKQLTDDERLILRVKKQRAALFLKAPGTYSMMGGLPIELSTEIGTFATDGYTIFVNREFAKTLTDLDVRGVLIHEARHVSGLHHTRNHKGKYHHQLWNIATDYILNGDIKASENYGTDFTLPDNLLWDDFYSTSGWNAEKICNEMLKKGWTPPEEPDANGDDSTDKPNGQPNGNSGGSQGKPMDNGIGEILPAPALTDPASAETETARNEAIKAENEAVRKRVADAALMEKAMGNGKGGMFNRIVDSYGKTTSVEHIRHFLRSHFSFTRSFKRPNKRFLHKKIYLPSKRKTPHTLYCAIDSSASVGMTEFESYRKNLVRWAKELGLSKIKVAYIDSYIHMNKKTDTPWYDIDLTHGTGADAMALDVYGGGGTSFDPIFNYLDKTKEDVGGLVYFTDGFGNVTMRNPSFPVLWVTSGIAPSFRTSTGARTKQTFGKVVEI